METQTILTPLSIVLAFIGVIEATLAYRVTSLQGKAQMIFVWFMVTFPALVLAGFFYVQLTAPLSWYPPSELQQASSDHLSFLDYRDKFIEIAEAAERGDTVKVTQGLLTVSSNNSGELIRKYWKPDGKDINKENDSNIKDWMRDNGLNTSPGSLTMFIYSDDLKDLRNKAVKDLGLYDE